MTTADEPGTATTPPPMSAMDGWRVVTGILTVLFLCGSVFLFAAASDARQEAEECVRAGGWLFCWDLTVPLLIGGTWLFLLATCFAGATAAPLGAWRRRLVIVGVCLGVFPIGLWLLLLRSPIALLMVAGLIVYVVALRRVGGQRAADGSVTAAGGQDDGAR